MIKKNKQWHKVLTHNISRGVMGLIFQSFFNNIKNVKDIENSFLEVMKKEKKVKKENK
jgi:hypothetical protein